METRASSRTREVIISGERPTVLIGERINPTGKKSFAEALRAGNLEIVREEALAQVKAGADVIDINVGAASVDEVTMLPQAVSVAMEAVDAPLCLDSANPEALEAALRVYQGKPIINSVKGEELSLKTILPMVKEYGAAVIGLTIDDDGIPKDAEARLRIAAKIVDRAEKIGILREDIIIDCLCLAASVDAKAGPMIIEAIRRITAELGVNQTIGASNISFHMPDRELINNAFLPVAITAGVTCPIVDAAHARPIVVATDLILGRDNYGRRYIAHFRSTKS